MLLPEEGLRLEGDDLLLPEEEHLPKKTTFLHNLPRSSPELSGSVHSVGIYVLEACWFHFGAFMSAAF